MTDKVTLSSLATFDNSILANVNANNAALTTAIDNTLSRDGTSPNQMGASLDMNSNQIINLPAPGSASSPARLQDVVGGATINIALQLSGDVSSPSSSGVLTTTVNKIKGVGLGTTTATSGNSLIADGTNWQSVAMSGDVTQASTGATTIGANKISLAKMATQANNTILGNVSGGTAVPSALTATQATALINPVTSSLSGAAPASGGGTTNFLRADATWAAPSFTQTKVLLNTLTASSSASLTDLTSFTSTYSYYELVLSNLVPATTTRILQFLVHTGGAYQTTGYLQLCCTGAGSSVSNVTTYIPITYPASGTGGAPTNILPGINGVVRIHTPSTSGLIMVEGFTAYAAAGVVQTVTFGGYWNSTAVVDGFKLLMDSGNLSSGTVKVYGIL